MPCFRASRRRVRRRTTGQAPAATARNNSTTSASTTAPSDKAPIPGSPGKPRPRMRGPSHQGPGGGPSRPMPGRSPIPAPGRRMPPKRAIHSVRPSSSRTGSPRRAMGTPSASRLAQDSDTPMRRPAASSRASGRRRRCDHSDRAATCCSGGAWAGGSERSSKSAQASARLWATASKRSRSCAMWRCTSHPEARANRLSAASTVSQMRRYRDFMDAKGQGEQRRRGLEGSGRQPA